MVEPLPRHAEARCFAPLVTQPERFLADLIDLTIWKT